MTKFFYHQFLKAPILIEYSQFYSNVYQIFNKLGINKKNYKMTKLLKSTEKPLSVGQKKTA